MVCTSIGVEDDEAAEAEGPSARQHSIAPMESSLSKRTTARCNGSARAWPLSRARVRHSWSVLLVASVNVLSFIVIVCVCY